MPIAYCAYRQSYFYEKEGRMEILLGFKPLEQGRNEKCGRRDYA